jgi:pimeloyl-[acyl-carrier protein] synthase
MTLVQEKPARASTPLDVDLTSQEYLAAPWRWLRQIAAADPVFWSNHLNAWVVTRHEDVKAAYADRRLSTARMELYLRSLPGRPAERFPDLLKYHSLSIAFMDPPDHMRIRMLIMKAFGRRIIEALKPLISQIIDELLDDAEALGDFDFIERVATKLPSRVIQSMLGVPSAMTDEFYALATEVMRAMGTAAPGEQLMRNADTAVVTLNRVFTMLIDERRRTPSEDLLSALVNARDADDRLSEDELLAACHTILEAGGETTSHMLAVCVNEIASRPDLRSLVESGVDGALRVTDELLRFPGLVMGMTRVIKEPFEWHGRALRAGDIIFMMNCAGNVDSDVFDRPEEIDPMRDTRASLAFGPGLHSCVGHFLARTELSQCLYRVFNRFAVTITEQNIRFIQSYVFRGYERLHVSFVPKRPATVP